MCGRDPHFYEIVKHFLIKNLIERDLNVIPISYKHVVEHSNTMKYQNYVDRSDPNLQLTNT